MKYIYMFLIFWLLCTSSISASAYSNNAKELEQKLLHFCKQVSGNVELAKKYKYEPGHNINPLSPSNYTQYRLGDLVDLTHYKLSERQTKMLLSHLESRRCLQTIRDFSTLFEEEVENKALDDFQAFYKTAPIKKLPANSAINVKLSILEKMMAIPKGFKFPYVKNYSTLVGDALEMLSEGKKNRNVVELNGNKTYIPNLRGKYVTFVGAGFPLSGVMINILSHAKVNLVEIDPNALKRAKNFLVVLDKAGIINLQDFTLKLENGKNLIYAAQANNSGHIKTDILYLAAALPTDVKKDIFKKIYEAKNHELVIIDRYISGIFKALYQSKVNSKDIPYFKTLGKIYPPNLYSQKLKENSVGIRIKAANKMNENSTRILMLR